MVFSKIFKLSVTVFWLPQDQLGLLISRPLTERQTVSSVYQSAACFLKSHWEPFNGVVSLSPAGYSVRFEQTTLQFLIQWFTTLSFPPQNLKKRLDGRDIRKGGYCIYYKLRKKGSNQMDENVGMIY